MPATKPRPASTSAEELDELTWSAAASEALEAYHSGHQRADTIAVRHGLTKEQLLALVDAAGYARHGQRARRTARAASGTPAVATASTGGAGDE